MTTADTRSLASLPKTHLHVHLEGAIRPTTLAEFADRYGVEVPAPPDHFDGFQHFLSLYRSVCGVIRTVDDRQRVMREIVEDSVWGAREALGADRVQHGVRAVEDRDLVCRLADQGICLDVPRPSTSLSAWSRTRRAPPAATAGRRRRLQHQRRPPASVPARVGG